MEVLIVVAIIAVGAYVALTNFGSIVQPVGPTMVSTTCYISGQPGPFYLRVLSDATQTPLSGARVSATNRAAYCDGTPATTIWTFTFTSNATEWYSLNTQNNAGYSLSVSYSGRIYTLDADLRPVSVTCATLYVPSGRINVTIREMQTSCLSTNTAP